MSTQAEGAWLQNFFNIYSLCILLQAILLIASDGKTQFAIKRISQSIPDLQYTILLLGMWCNFFVLTQKCRDTVLET